MKVVFPAAALAAVITAAPTSNTARQSASLGNALDNLEGYLPIVGGNKGPLIPGLGGDNKARRQESGNNGSTSEIADLIAEIQSVLNGTSDRDLGQLLDQLEGYLPIVGGNEGPIIPGLGGDR